MSKCLFKLYKVFNWKFIWLSHTYLPLFSKYLTENSFFQFNLNCSSSSSAKRDLTSINTSKIEIREMSQSNMQKIYQLLVFVMLIGLSVSRPNGSTDTQVSKQLIILSNTVDSWLEELSTTKNITWLNFNFTIFE